nr:hypothetical protein [Sphingobium sp. YR768]
MEAVEEALALFNNRFGRRDIIKSWREGVIPESGQIRQGVAYQMHGIGCWVDISGEEMDFDFAYSNDIGFDAWRLWSYAKQFPERYPDNDKAAVEHELEEAVGAGLVEPCGGHSNLLRIDIAQEQQKHLRPLPHTALLA